MKKTIAILIFLFFNFSVQEVSAQKINYKKIEKLIYDLESTNKFSGAVLIAERGKVKFKKAVGFSNYEKHIALQTSSIFELASISKQFTAMTIMMLKEKGLLNYDDFVEKYLNIPYKGITIRQLLTHTSGLPDYQLLMDSYWDKSKVAGNKEVIEYLNKYAPSKLFDPGTKYSYSNTGYLLLASITEKVSGRDFIEFCNTEIFHKLKMQHTDIRNLTQKSKLKNFALGHIFVPEKNDYIKADSFPASNYTIWLGDRKGPGRISSTLDDLLKWDQALYGEQLVQQETLKDAFNPMTLSNKIVSNYGFGWELIPNENIVLHTGDNPGYKTIIIRFLNKRITLVLLCNNASEEFVSMTDSIKNLILNTNFLK